MEDNNHDIKFNIKTWIINVLYRFDDECIEKVRDLIACGEEGIKELTLPKPI